MRILWICNIMLPVVAQQLGLESSNKEGWLSGLCGTILGRQTENQIGLHVAFPVGREMDGCEGEAVTETGSLRYYGFYEDVAHAERYDSELENRIRRIMDRVKPDVVHCFGTEYGHTLAACRVISDRSRILVGLQGLCSACANAYFANLPQEVVQGVTFRDWVKQDTLLQQRHKFEQRGEVEREIIGLAGNVTGRTAWDRFYSAKWNPQARYFAMNETLRSDFYAGSWREEDAIPHSIFLSQGDYPIKGLHYMLLSMPVILERYPDAAVYVAGNSLVNDRTVKDRLKISAYGKYLRRLIREGQLGERVHFLGRLNAEQMKERYLRSSLFVCCSSIENSPNSLGEAMLLGMPCVSADVGGIPSIFRGGEDGILYEGFKTPGNEFDNTCDAKISNDEQLKNIVKSLADAVISMWDNEEERKIFCKNARNHALKTHDAETNYKKLVEIYAEISG